MMLRPLGAALRSLGKAIDGAGAAMQGSDAFIEKRESPDCWSCVVVLLESMQPSQSMSVLISGAQPGGENPPATTGSSRLIVLEMQRVVFRHSGQLSVR